MAACGSPANPRSERAGQPRTGGAQRVAKRDGAAIGVHMCGVIGEIT